MKLELTYEQLQVLEIALTELFNSDSWTWSVKSNEVDRIADRGEYLLKMIAEAKGKSLDAMYESDVRAHR